MRISRQRLHRDATDHGIEVAKMRLEVEQSGNQTIEQSSNRTSNTTRRSRFESCNRVFATCGVATAAESRVFAASGAACGQLATSVAAATRLLATCRGGGGGEEEQPKPSNEYLPPATSTTTTTEATTEEATTAEAATTTELPTEAPQPEQQEETETEAPLDAKTHEDIVHGAGDLLDDGYHYQTPEIVPDLTPNAAQVEAYLPPLDDNAVIAEQLPQSEESAALLHDGYHYRAIRRLRL
ncbi:hypothetical protein ACLKA6_011471 [Drosophila palustris]